MAGMSLGFRNITNPVGAANAAGYRKGYGSFSTEGIEKHAKRAQLGVEKARSHEPMRRFGDLVYAKADVAVARTLVGEVARLFNMPGEVNVEAPTGAVSEVLQQTKSELARFLSIIRGNHSSSDPQEIIRNALTSATIAYKGLENLMPRVEEPGWKAINLEL
jgi:hypothetical protein